MRPPLTAPDDFAYKPLHPRWHTVMDGGLEDETIGDVITRLGKGRPLLPAHPPRIGHQLQARRQRQQGDRQAGRMGRPQRRHGVGYFEDANVWEDNALIGAL
ncbi:hypothetical protein [Streptomyces sp. NPDC050564]|uniref:hypothetical protein n=1 Tax=Streptomyces sp. NPDC050564 TaxID=3365631 RepID=UPI00378CAF28